MSKFQPTRWRKAVRELIKPELLGISHSTIANEIGIARVVVTLQLGKKRTPPPERVYAINEAIGKLVSSKQVQRYLDATYLLDAYAADETDLWPEPWTDVLDAVAAAFNDISDHLKEGWFDELVQVLAPVISPSPKKRQVSFMLEMSQATWKRLIRNIDGNESRITRFEEVRSICAKYGVDISPILAAEDALQNAIKRDLFCQTLRTQLAALTPNDFAARNKAYRQILGSYNSLYGIVLDRTIEFGESPKREVA